MKTIIHKNGADHYRLYKKAAKRAAMTVLAKSPQRIAILEQTKSGEILIGVDNGDIIVLDLLVTDPDTNAARPCIIMAAQSHANDYISNAVIDVTQTDMDELYRHCVMTKPMRNALMKLSLKYAYMPNAHDVKKLNGMKRHDRENGHEDMVLTAKGREKILRALKRIMPDAKRTIDKADPHGQAVVEPDGTVTSVAFEGFANKRTPQGGISNVMLRVSVSQDNKRYINRMEINVRGFTRMNANTGYVPHEYYADMTDMVELTRKRISEKTVGVGRTARSPFEVPVGHEMMIQ